MHLHSQTWLAMAKFPTRLRKLRATVDGLNNSLTGYLCKLQISPLRCWGRMLESFGTNPTAESCAEIK